jgi:DNA (cytosine-5)-methyltransferase 1
MTERPRLLDLFCGAGGAAMGYNRAGFDVVGVDIRPQPNYPFEFIQADALDYLAELHERPLHVWYEAIHASPPCQTYTTMNNRHGSDSPPLITETRALLEATGLPYVIENVPGARSHMLEPATITGETVGLRVHRPRLFETNWTLMVSRAPRQRDPVAVYGKQDGRRLWTRADGSELRAALWPEASVAMGIDWMTWDELCEAIPPAYTELIGHQLRQHVRRVAA